MITTLRDALHEDIHNGDIPIRQLADRLGISYSYLANAGNPNLDEFHFQLRHLTPLLVLKRFHTLDYLEHMAGRVAFTLPEVTAGPNVEMNRNLLEMMSHMGELANKQLEALADGKIDAREAKELETLLFEIGKHSILHAVALGKRVEQ